MQKNTKSMRLFVNSRELESQFFSVMWIIVDVGGITMKTEFDRIAGYKEEKQELYKICSLIKRMDELEKMGGKLPRGLFLIGPNGVGKTVMAESFIKESKCESVSISYNDLDNDDEFIPYIKSKFAEAASKAPCILFIDELDKLIGNSRHFFMADNFDRSRVILNEINKYSKIDGLFLLIVANKNYELDKSIIRSGRIDNIIEINLPNESERREIINYYCNGKNIDESINVNKLSKLLRGFSGADIESLLNNAVIRSFANNKKVVSNEDLMGVYYDKVFNCKEKESNFDEESQKIVAYHEAGHAVLTLLIDPSSLNCASILTRNEIKGFVNQSSSESNITTFETELDKAKISLAGLVSEELFFNKRSSGSESDIFNVKQTIMRLVRMQGLCGLDKIYLPFSMDSMVPGTETISDSRIKAIEDAENKTIDDLYQSTKKLLEDNKELVVLFANELIKKKVLNKDDIDRIYKKYCSNK